MSEKTNARNKLGQARYFALQASRAAADRDALVSNFEAAIVFARSVTLCLQSDFHDSPGFPEWYSQKQEMMRKDPIFNLFVEKRNYILKEGTAVVHKTIKVEITETIGVSEFFTCKVKRGQPWYRRPPKMLWEDIRAAIREPLREWLWKRKRRQEAKLKITSTQAKVSGGHYFDDPAWSGREVFALFEEYLGKLELIVDEAERTFS